MLIAAINFSVNLGQFISLPAFLAVIAALLWLKAQVKRQLAPLESSIANIEASVAAAVDGRFLKVEERSADNLAKLMTELGLIKVQVIATNGRLLVLEGKVATLEQSDSQTALTLARLQGRAEKQAEIDQSRGPSP